MDRETLLAAMRETARAKPTPVKVAEWGTVYIRNLTVAEVEEQADDTSDKKDKNRIARAAARVIADEKGKRIFDPNNADDISLIASQPWSLLRKVLQASGSELGDPSGN